MLARLRPAYEFVNRLMPGICIGCLVTCLAWAWHLDSKNKRVPPNARRIPLSKMPGRLKPGVTIDDEDFLDPNPKGGQRVDPNHDKDIQTVGPL